ncbi:GMC oxidoreductase [Bipolaris victoriae FI3]|uniref:GMC oxidoreductase n=2 Tax=Bipolaris TaxID=33194 RepID=W6Y9S5_COCC2|nr:GMC oxidoreductase [Bipolaris zeicola 26-R-13]XP_014551589.1 GMC oxidoreductase [Bipolaris victoriae FI3]EUC34723.1 GMC oxidoreductase [Bipolaris zeicola 26-R-13]
MSDEGVTSRAPAEDLTSRSYDYIICGGGTAGLAVASRLSEDENVTVAVLEAGGNALNDLLVDAPSMYTQTWGNPNYDWDYKTVPQKGTAGRVHGWIRGKVLGGSSAVNYGMFSMASKQDLDNWGELGNKGWSFEDLKPYYRKFETYHPASEAYGEKIDNKYLDKSLRGTSGPIHISFAETDVTWSQDMWPKTIINAGYLPANDPRVGSSIGGFNQLCTIDPRHNRRSYSARDYYEPAKDRPNLFLLTHALVSKIELEKNADTVKATGVQFTVDGSPFTVKANREVIICGGVVNSPQILELSGIGSPDVLQKAGVEVIVDLPGVGDNLCDHSATAVVLGVKDEYPTAEALFRDPTLTQQALEAYLTHKSGPFAAGPTTAGFASLQKVSPDLSNPQSHIDSLLASTTTSDPAGRDPLTARQLLNPKEAVCQLVFLPLGINTYRPENANQLLPCEDPGMWATLGVCSTRSFSRGSTHITSSNPEAYPAIDPAYFAHPLDIDLMARSVMHALSFADVEPLKQIFKRDEKGGLVVPQNASGPLPRDVEEAKEWVQKNTVTEYHPVGTCAMLPREKGGVVDEELRVYGVQGLRVVDASIFPLHVQGNIVSLVYAIAEKAADMIRGRRRRPDSGHWA